MRKTSQDGGDTTSIKSGIENEVKKPGAAILKTKRNSIKRKVQNYSNEIDETVIEPLLEKENYKPEPLNNRAKYTTLLSKTKTDAIGEKANDTAKLITDETPQKTSTTIETTLPSTREVITAKQPPLHNHMNTNVFSTPDNLQGYIAPKSQILVEMDGTKQIGYNPSPLIFTTAKIHIDGKTKQMEPVHVTPVPILSTTEVSVLKNGGFINKIEIAGPSTNVTTMFVNRSKTNPNVPIDKEQKTKGKAVANNNMTTVSSKNVESKLPNSLSTTLASTTAANLIKEIVKDTKITDTFGATNNIKAISITKVKDEIEDIKTSSHSQATSSVILENEKDNIAAHDVAPKKAKGDILLGPKIDINKNINTGSSYMGVLPQSEVFDSSKTINNVKNPSEPIKNDTNLKSNNGSISNRLQRQKYAIMSETDDSVSKVKPNVNLTSQSDPIKTTSGNIVSTTEIIAQNMKSPLIEENILNHTSKKLQSGANSKTTTTTNTFNTNDSTTESIKTSTSNSLPAKVLNTANTSIASSTMHSNVPSTTVAVDTGNTKSLTKSSSNSVSSSGKIEESDTKPMASETVTKPEVKRNDITSSLTSTKTSIKTTKPPIADTPLKKTAPPTTKVSDAGVSVPVTTKASNIKAPFPNIAPQTIKASNVGVPVTNIVTNTTKASSARAPITNTTVPKSVGDKTKSQLTTGKSVECTTTCSSAFVTKPTTVKSNTTLESSVKTQGTSQVTSTVSITPSASSQKSTASLKKNGEKSQDRNSKSLKD